MKQLSRRQILYLSCANAASALMPSIFKEAHAGLLHRGGPQFSQRNVVNLGFTFDNSYPLINFYLMGGNSTGPAGSAFSTGAPLWPAVIDANGWPNQVGVSGTDFGGGPQIPGSDEYTGSWVIKWNGSGRTSFNVGTWTETNLVVPGTGVFTNGSASISFANVFAAGQQVVFTTTGTLPSNFSSLTVYYVMSTGLSGVAFQVSATKGGSAIVAGSAGSGTQTVNGTYTKNSNGRWTNTFDTVSPYITATLSGATGPQTIGVHFEQTDPNLTGNYLTNFMFYQVGDEADLLAGKIFRAAYKQSLVNLNPSAIRFLDWMGGSSAMTYRFENRSLPNYGGYAFVNWLASPSYPVVTGTNIYTLAAAIPTASNPKNTPASLTHGEVVTARFTSGSVRGNAVAVSAITNANPGQVTATAHGYSNGDVVQLFNMVGMTKLNYFPVTVANATANNFTIGVDTTSYGAFTSGSVTTYNSINIGARGAKPIAFITGGWPASVFGDQIAAATYQTLVYDKNVSVLGDGAGNLIAGAWILQTSAIGYSGWQDGVPLEIMVALVNEVNALSVSQGKNNPINMWLNIGHNALTSMDPDYATASDYGLNAADVITNVSSARRTVGYSALTANAKLFLEYSNETWNSAGGFYAYYYLNRMGFLRWPTSGTTDAVDMYALRSTIVMRTVKSTFGTSRIKYILSGQGFAGFGVGNLNQLRCDGSPTPGSGGNFYTTDPIVTSGSFGTPISNHDVFATATYFDAGPIYYMASGTGSFTDDSAMYAGTTPYSSPNQAQALTNFVTQVVSNPGADVNAQPVNGYLNNSLSGLTATYAAAMVIRGKTAIGYEGGPDWPTATGSQTEGGHVITAADNVFLIAALNSTQWRDAQVNYFNRVATVAGAAMPAIFTYIGAAIGNQRWAYTTPDSFGGTVTEGQGLLNNPTWVGMSSRNQGLVN